MKNATLRIGVLALATLTGLLVARPAAAQQYYYPAYQPPPAYPPPPPPARRHYGVRGYFGGGAFGTAILHQAGGPEPLYHGGGFDLFGGLRFGRIIGLEFGWMASFHNPKSSLQYDPYWGAWYKENNYLVFQGLTVDAKIHIPTYSNFDPFVQGGGGVYFLGREGMGVDSAGGGFQVGGGFNVWFGPMFGFGVRALYRGVALGPPQGGTKDVFISALTAEANLQLRF